MHSKAMNTPAVLVPLNASTSRTTQGWGGRVRSTRSSRDTRRRTFTRVVGQDFGLWMWVMDWGRGQGWAGREGLSRGARSGVRPTGSCTPVMETCQGKFVRLSTRAALGSECKSCLGQRSTNPCALLTAGLSMLRTALTANLSPVGSRSHSYTWKGQTLSTRQASFTGHHQVPDRSVICVGYNGQS